MTAADVDVGEDKMVLGIVIRNSVSEGAGIFI